MTRTKGSLGLALSGGTLKASAHVGVLQAFERMGIQPDVVAGTSAGSLVSALYAHGFRTAQFQRLIESFPGVKLMDFGFPIWSSMWSFAFNYMRTSKSNQFPVVPSGILKGRKLKDYIEKLISPRRMQIPLYIVATDLVSGRPIALSPEDATNRADDAFIHISDVSQAIVGSCALPGVFTPVAMDKYLLVDGAMRHYVPVSVLKSIGCDKIIAVNLYQLPTEYQPRTLVDVLARSFDILLRETIDNDIENDERTFILEPDVSSVHWRRFSQMQDCVEIGRKLVESKERELHEFLNR